MRLSVSASTMMALPPGLEGAHDADFYLRVLEDILDDGVPFTSICFKDASGTTTPRVVHDTIRAARKRVPEGTPLRLHFRQKRRAGEGKPG